MVMQSENQEARVWQWIDEVVIGLNLCPFAAYPRRKNQIRVCISEVTEEADVLTLLVDELIRLDETPVEQLETTVLAFPNMWPDFLDYNDFLWQTERLLSKCDRDGVYQIASFHPGYQFSGTTNDDVGNLTNRSPYPILHLIREDSVEIALEKHPNPDAIPFTNIARMRSLSIEERKRLFPWLFKS
ncbi:DUF1415 domain-containing protein [Nitrincola alkalisediminis]